MELNYTPSTQKQQQQKQQSLNKQVKVGFSQPQQKGDVAGGVVYSNNVQQDGVWPMGDTSRTPATATIISQAGNSGARQAQIQGVVTSNSYVAQPLQVRQGSLLANSAVRPGLNDQSQAVDQNVINAPQHSATLVQRPNMIDPNVRQHTITQGQGHGVVGSRGVVGPLGGGQRVVPLHAGQGTIQSAWNGPTQEQKQTLISQIQVYKKMKGRMQVTQDDVKSCKPSALLDISSVNVMSLQVPVHTQTHGATSRGKRQIVGNISGVSSGGPATIVTSFVSDSGQQNRLGSGMIVRTVDSKQQVDAGLGQGTQAGTQWLAVTTNAQGSGKQVVGSVVSSNQPGTGYPRPTQHTYSQAKQIKGNNIQLQPQVQQFQRVKQGGGALVGIGAGTGTLAARFSQVGTGQQGMQIVGNTQNIKIVNTGDDNSAYRTAKSVSSSIREYVRGQLQVGCSEIVKQGGPVITQESIQQAKGYPQSKVTYQPDIPALMKTHYKSQLQKVKQRKLNSIYDFAGSCSGGYGVSKSGKLGIGSVHLKRRYFSALELQRKWRSLITSDFETVLSYSSRQSQRLMKEIGKWKNDLARADHKNGIGKMGTLKELFGKKRAFLQTNARNKVDARKARVSILSRVHERLQRACKPVSMAFDGNEAAQRMEALQKKDFEAYARMLEAQQPEQSGEEGYQEIQKFLVQTEQYIGSLAQRVATNKLEAMKKQAFEDAKAEGRELGLSGVKLDEMAYDRSRNRIIELEYEMERLKNNASGDAQSRYQSLAHHVSEVVKCQPTMLKGPKGAKLKEYQITGLQWMVSLYNNQLNGILADEMGLGKTVQVMALIAYLWEHKQNYGPYLVVVPNAVLLNWRLEMDKWLPNVRCIYYIGDPAARKQLRVEQVLPLKFNVLITTYEFAMKDKAGLSNVSWQYLIVDEAQRVKDQQSKLARDLRAFECKRCLLLTGTPLQNNLKELWDLLNLLLPKVFENKASFVDWFADQVDKRNTSDSMEQRVIAKEKHVLLVNRLHQILEPFVLRRQVKDVEGKLPPKIAVVVKVPLSGFQQLIYTWVRLTGTLRMKKQWLKGDAQIRGFAGLQNKVMELRKTCNHPLLCYPKLDWNGQELLQMSGKMCVLDRLLVKLFYSGHKVLLFSTMTLLLNLVEFYLSWRRLPLPPYGQMTFRRIDGGTLIQDREIAINDFNDPNQNVFIFLLSIKAAGRGLNLQSADTVIIYDPDPNPKNEEQAIARAHRIGQTKEVRVIHFESVEETSGQVLNAQQEQKNGQMAQTSKRYVESVESLIRNNIQKTKIEMANEIIDAGQFDTRTTNEQRRKTLETLLNDDNRFEKPNIAIPKLSELNKLIARGDAELRRFQELDRLGRDPKVTPKEYADQPPSFFWPSIPCNIPSAPSFLKFMEQQLRDAIEAQEKPKYHRRTKRSHKDPLALLDKELTGQQYSSAALQDSLAKQGHIQGIANGKSGDVGIGDGGNGETDADEEEDEEELVEHNVQEDDIAAKETDSKQLAKGFGASEGEAAVLQGDGKQDSEQTLTQSNGQPKAKSGLVQDSEWSVGDGDANLSAKRSSRRKGGSWAKERGKGKRGAATKQTQKVVKGQYKAANGAAPGTAQTRNVVKDAVQQVGGDVADPADSVIGRSRRSKRKPVESSRKYDADFFAEDDDLFLNDVDSDQKYSKKQKRGVDRSSVPGIVKSSQLQAKPDEAISLPAQPQPSSLYDMQNAAAVATDINGVTTEVNEDRHEGVDGFKVDDSGTAQPQPLLQSQHVEGLQQQYPVLPHQSKPTKRKGKKKKSKKGLSKSKKAADILPNQATSQASQQAAIWMENQAYQQTQQHHFLQQRQHIMQQQQYTYGMQDPIAPRSDDTSTWPEQSQALLTKILSNVDTLIKGKILTGTDKPAVIAFLMGNKLQELAKQQYFVEELVRRLQLRYESQTMYNQQWRIDKNAVDDSYQQRQAISSSKHAYMQASQAHQTHHASNPQHYHNPSPLIQQAPSGHHSQSELHHEHSSQHVHGNPPTAPSVPTFKLKIKNKWGQGSGGGASGEVQQDQAAASALPLQLGQQQVKSQQASAQQVSTGTSEQPTVTEKATEFVSAGNVEKSQRQETKYNVQQVQQHNVQQGGVPSVSVLPSDGAVQQTIVGGEHDDSKEKLSKEGKQSKHGKSSKHKHKDKDKHKHKEKNKHRDKDGHKSKEKHKSKSKSKEDKDKKGKGATMEGVLPEISNIAPSTIDSVKEEPQGQILTDTMRDNSMNLQNEQMKQENDSVNEALDVIQMGTEEPQQEANQQQSTDKAQAASQLKLPKLKIILDMKQ